CIRSERRRDRNHEALSRRTIHSRGVGAHRSARPQGRWFPHPQHADRYEHVDGAHDPRIDPRLVAWYLAAAFGALGVDSRLAARALTAGSGSAAKLHPSLKLASLDMEEFDADAPNNDLDGRGLQRVGRLACVVGERETR